MPRLQLERQEFDRGVEAEDVLPHHGETGRLDVVRTRPGFPQEKIYIVLSISQGRLCAKIIALESIYTL